MKPSFRKTLLTVFIICGSFGSAIKCIAQEYFTLRELETLGSLEDISLMEQAANSKGYYSKKLFSDVNLFNDSFGNHVAILVQGKALCFIQ